MSISVFRPTIKRRDMDAVLSCMVSDDIGPGQRAQNLVREVSRYLGISGGIALRDFGTSIRLVVEALGLKKGSSVIVSPLAPREYRDLIERHGLVPLYADVDINNACIDPKSVEKLLHHDPSALFFHSPLGYAADMQSLASLGLPIIEDITSCVGAYNGESRMGSFGRYVIVGLEQYGVITGGGGAMVLSQSNRDLGNLRRAAESLPSSTKLPDINASLALSQFARLEEFLQQRRDIGGVFHNALAESFHRTLTQNGDGENVFYSFPVLLEGSMKEAAAYAKTKKVETHPAFADSLLSVGDLENSDCPNAKTMLMRCLLFPLYPTLDRTSVVQVAKVLSTLP